MDLATIDFEKLSAEWLIAWKDACTVCPRYNGPYENLSELENYKLARDAVKLMGRFMNKAIDDFFISKGITNEHDQHILNKIIMDLRSVDLAIDGFKYTSRRD